MRSTMDMDTTIKGIPVNEKTISKIVKEILEIEIDADIDYKLVKLTQSDKKTCMKIFVQKFLVLLEKLMPF